MWDQQFSSEQYKYGKAPNAFLAEQAAVFAPGSQVLVPGDGEGRNGVWLAEQGHHVVSTDGSAVGLSKAQALAQERGVTIETMHVDFADWAPQAQSVDAVVLTYVHLPPGLRQQVHAAAVQALRPGGYLLLEAFAPEQLAYSSGGPKNPDWLYPLDMLRSDWGPAMQEELGWSDVVALSEGPGHTGDAHVVRWLGKKQ